MHVRPVAMVPRLACANSDVITLFRNIPSEAFSNALLPSPREMMGSVDHRTRTRRRTAIQKIGNANA